MESIARRYGKMQHTGAFFLIISSHGGEGDVVYGTDGRIVSVHHLEKHFHATNCHSLAGKPKVFVIDACRGDIGEKVYFTSKSVPQSSSTSGTIRVTDSSDIMTIFASTRGHTAGCNDDEGSFLIQAFVKVLKKASTDDHLLNIMMKVQKEVEKFFGDDVQTPQIEFTCFRRSTELNKYLNLSKKLDKAVEEWLPVRKQTIREIRKAADNLQEHHSNVNKSRIIGATASIGGGALAILGFALTPVTFGGSLALSAIGIGAAAVGGGTVAGASIADIIIEKSGIKDVQKTCNEDYRQLRIVEGIITEIKQVVENMYRRCCTYK
uniref:Caspase family p20 domain-containing protein n=1 Tax=Amphimedon queenslandica TaxID=400682 RepID=A0A1X7TTQ1_AMPQE